MTSSLPKPPSYLLDFCYGFGKLVVFASGNLVLLRLKSLPVRLHDVDRAFRVFLQTHEFLNDAGCLATVAQQQLRANADRCRVPSARRWRFQGNVTSALSLQRFGRLPSKKFCCKTKPDVAEAFS